MTRGARNVHTVIAAATGLDVLVAAIASLPGLVAAVVAILTRRKVGKVHDEVTTMNGQTMAVLADRVEGRRIEADILEGDRTAAEQNYVTKLTEPSPGEVAEGQDPPR